MRARSLALGLASDGEEELEFWGELVLGVETVREVDAADAAVGVDLDSKRRGGVSYSSDSNRPVLGGLGAGWLT